MRATLYFGVAFLAIALVAVVALVAIGGDQRSFTTPIPASTSPEGTVIVKQLPGSGPAAKFGATEVYDACSLLPVASLEQFGVSLRPNSTLMHGYVEGDVPASLAMAQQPTASTSFCDYTLTNNNRVYLHIYQTPYVSTKELAFLADRPSREDERDGSRFTITKPELVASGMVETRKSQTFGSLDAKAFVDKVITLVTDNLRKPPTASMRHVYSMLFDDVPPVCSAASASAVTKGVPMTSAALVQAQYYLTAERHRIEGSSETGLQSATSCQRTNVVFDGSLNDQEWRIVQVRFSMWDRPAAATGSNNYLCDPTKEHPGKPPVRADISIGTGKTCMSNVLNDWQLDFQVGKVNVMVSTGLGEQSTPEAREPQVAPIGVAVASALAN